MPTSTTQEASSILSMLAATGALVGIGKLLASGDHLTLRIVGGRALTSAGMGAAAAVVLSFFPNMPLAAQCGVAALLASLGTSGIETLYKHVFGLTD